MALTLFRDDPFFGNLWPAESNTFNREHMLGSTDIVETKEAHIFKTDAPGMNADDVKVEVHDGNILTISGERSREHKTDDKDNHYHRVERSYGKFTRSFKLPDDCDPSKVAADFKDGVLQVSVPKTTSPPPRSRQVAINYS